MRAIIEDWSTNIYPTDNEVTELCKPGHGSDTCIWLVASSGWECVCLNRPNSLVERWERGETVAKRDGCDKVNSFNPSEHELGEVEF